MLGLLTDWLQSDSKAAVHRSGRGRWASCSGSTHPSTHQPGPAPRVPHNPSPYQPVCGKGMRQWGGCVRDGSRAGPSVAACKRFTSLEAIDRAAVGTFTFAVVPYVDVNAGVVVPQLHVGAGIRAKDTASGVEVAGAQFDNGGVGAHGGADVVVALREGCRAGILMSANAGARQPRRAVPACGQGRRSRNQGV